MNGGPGRSGDIPIWVWVVGAIVLFQVVDEVWGLFPLVVIALVVWQSSRRPGITRTPPGQPVPPPGPAGEPTHLPPPYGEPSPWVATPYPTGDGTPPPSPMPRIEVPRYPGSTGAGPFTDPAVSLAMLQVSQAGRDLTEARRAGNDARVQQVLAQLRQSVDGARDALATSAHDAPRSRELRGALGRLRDHAAAAEKAGGGADPSLLDGISARAIAMGETGRHE